MAVIYRTTPTTPPIRVCFNQALIGLFALVTKRHCLHVEEHVGIFAGSLLHRGGWEHKEGAI
jgi:hypothetical protein